MMTATEKFSSELFLHQPDLTNGYKRFPLPFSSCFHAVEEESGNREESGPGDNDEKPSLSVSSFLSTAVPGF